MRARAPGKVVLSGSYAVLEGAPALVAAVDRYAYADARVLVQSAPVEVLALGEARSYPQLDVSALCQDGRKLGLGSSAAALVACMATMDVHAHGRFDRASLFARALEAHASVHGGSGVDVAAAVYGGLRRYVRGQAPTRWALPEGLRWTLWSSAEPSSTRALVEQLRVFSRTSPDACASLMDALCAAAESAAGAPAAEDCLRSLQRQAELLAELEQAALMPIYGAVREELRGRVGREHGAVLLPGGAGGGDVYVLWASSSADMTRLGQVLADAGLAPLHVQVAEHGVEECA